MTVASCGHEIGSDLACSEGCWPKHPYGPLYALARYEAKAALDKRAFGHSVRVVRNLGKPGDVTGAMAQVAGILHDYVEDVGTVPPAWGAFPPIVQRAVLALTKQKGEDYLDYVRRCATDDVARRVKLADIRDNMVGIVEIKKGEKLIRKMLNYADALGILTS